MRDFAINRSFTLCLLPSGVCMSSFHNCQSWLLASKQARDKLKWGYESLMTNWRKISFVGGWHRQETMGGKAVEPRLKSEKHQRYGVATRGGYANACICFTQHTQSQFVSQSETQMAKVLWVFHMVSRHHSFKLNVDPRYDSINCLSFLSKKFIQHVAQWVVSRIGTQETGVRNPIAVLFFSFFL